MTLTNLLSPAHLISAYGLIGVSVIIFAETGLLIGFFFPGDSLLFLAGAYAASHGPIHLPLGWLLVCVSIAAVAGGQCGYFIGRVLGDRLTSGRGRIIKPRYIHRTQEVLTEYGETKAVLLARVIPIVRTFISPVVGMIEMPIAKFILANTIGGLIWAIGVTMLGYGLGSALNIDKYILPITGVIIVLSLIPIMREYLKQRGQRRVS